MTITPSHEDPLLTPEEVAKIFAVKAYTVRAWCKEGKIKGVKLPTGNWRIQNSEMVRFANERYGSDN